MQIVIDIPEETYKGIMLGKWDGNGLAYYVKSGTSLPKKHGRLIDGDILEDNLDWFEKVTNEDSIVDKAKHNMLINCIHIVRTTPTIIEAESEED